MFAGDLLEHAKARDELTVGGAQGFVGKPFDLQQLIDQTKSILPT